MDQYNEKENATETEGKVTGMYVDTQSRWTKWLGFIITIVAMVVIFVVASLEGTKEIKASNSDGGKMLNIWRESQGVTEGYPQEKTDIIKYNNHDYYFVVDKHNDADEIIKWHFSYDGKITYVFQDYKFYIMTGLAIVITMYVTFINYTSTVRTVIDTKSFKKTLIRYKEKKEKVDKFTQYIPDFCSYKNQQVREIAKRDIVESAQINYDYYISDKFNYDKLEKWQKKILKKIKKIKVKRIHSSDLLQESGTISTKIVLLPDGQQEHLVKFMISNGVQKIVVNGLSGFVVSFGIILGNWQLGLVYCFAVFVSSISAIIAGADYANYTLRNRYIAKGDLLVEFDNIKDMFINKSQYTDSKLLQNDLNKEPNVV